MFAAHRQSLIAEFRHPVYKDRRRQQANTWWLRQIISAQSA
jgi:hypothetical protein